MASETRMTDILVAGSGCNTWGMLYYRRAQPVGGPRYDTVHLILSNPEPMPSSPGRPREKVSHASALLPLYC